jgi:DNA polymerase I
MAHWEVRLLTASYKRGEDGLPVIEMFGKTREGQSLAMRYSGFLPYFHVIEPTEDVVNGLRHDSGVLRVDPIELWHRGEVKKAAQVTIRWPADVPSYRDRLKVRFQVLAADIPFHHRFIYDNDVASCVRVYGTEVKREGYTTDLAVDIERIDGKPHLENIDPFNPPLKILAFDVENSMRVNGKGQYGALYTVCYVVKDEDGLRGGPTFQGTEKEIIEHFNECVRKEDPDVITGYNIDGYDIPVMLDRARVNGIQSLRWGRDGGEPRQVYKKFWRLGGRIMVDAWWEVKKELKPKQETLNAVSRQLFNESKLDVVPSNIDAEWAADREKVLRYCTRDAELSLRILDRLGSLRKNMDLAAVSKLPCADVLNIGSSSLIDSILIRAADRAVPRVGVPMTGSFEEEEAIEGGYVHSIHPGLYHWVDVLDFKSMYPSLIIADNICFTTLSPHGTIAAPTGAKFLSKDQKEGLLPRILEELMKERDETKWRMREAKTPEEKQYYDGLQAAIKILMNSFYGVFASTFYRFTDRAIGSAITAFARERTKGIISALETEEYTVIYSDTDSIFVKSPHENLEGSIRFGKEMAERFSKEGGQLEFEKIFEAMFSHGKKKRYAGKVAWPKEELVIRGYETRRTDSFDLQSELLTEMFDKILSDNTEEAIRMARKAVQETMAGAVPIEKLVISRSCKQFSFYKDPDSQTTVQVARKLTALGYEFVPGMKVSWIVTNSKKSPQEVEPYIPGRKFETAPDWKYYAQRLAQTLGRATEVFGWDEKSLMTGSQQSDLFSGFGEGADTIPGSKGDASAPAKKDEVRKTEKKVSLQDFM